MMLKSFSLAIAALFSCGVAAQADIINIQLLDVDVVYKGSANSLYDATAVAGNNDLPAESDAIVAANFELNGSQVADQMGPGLWADLLIANMPSMLTKGVFQTSIGNAGGGFGFNFFNANTGEYLKLGVGSIDMLITNNVMFFTAPATVLSQNLPGGLAFGSTVDISYTATLPAVQAGATTNMAIASGVMTISGESVPEPTALVLVALGLAGGCFRRR